MFAQRYVYDPVLDQVVPVGTVRTSAAASAAYEDALGSYRKDRTRADRLRVAALDRADRREFAHKRYGDEQRWTET